MKRTTSGFKANEDTRIWCEYCHIFVYNNRINRDKHNNSQQHQTNFKKRVETIRKEEEQQKRLQSNIVTKPSASSKSFYGDSKASLNPQNQQNLNLLNMKSSTGDRKKILGLSSIETVPKVQKIYINDDIIDSTTSAKISVDIKSTASELKRKMNEDEKMVFEPKSEKPSIEEVTLESLNVFKKKKSK
jgi:hypothetical protein